MYMIYNLTFHLFSRFSGFATMENVHSYIEYKDKHSTKIGAKGMKKAIEECENYIKTTSVRITTFQRSF